MLPVTLSLFLLSFPISLTHSSIHHPSPLLSRLEHLLTSTHGSFRSGFADAITPCSNYVSGSQKTGRETSAQWLRVAFHDFVTARSDQGTGGLDASISMETLRDEDSGSAFNDTFAFFQPYIDAQTSAADLLAFSVVLALSNCGGLIVPLRGGRIDAQEPGPFGVPAPETNLSSTLQFFANAGFGREDAIGLTACGHSLGRVHHGGFPQVVPESAVSADNTAGGVDLDSTPATFDGDVVREYLGGYGQRGGPLVTSANETVRSDLRLYASDGNETMRGLVGRGEAGFADRCRELFGRMIETVPRGVVLSEVVRPMMVKPVNVTFDVDGDGRVVLRGVIRYLTQSVEDAPQILHLSLSTNYPSSSSSSTTTTASPLPETGYSIYGNTTYYPFSLPPLKPLTPTPHTLTITGSSSPSTTFTLNPSLFFVPSLTTLSSTNELRIVAAVLTNSNTTTRDVRSVRAKINFPAAQKGLNTLVPEIKSEEIGLSFFGRGSQYELYSGVWQGDQEMNWTSSSVDVWVEGMAGFVDEYNGLGYLVEG